MNGEQALDAVQQVLRGLTICLAMESKADMGRLSAALAEFARHPNLDGSARAMLLDLSTGLGMISSGGVKPN